MISGRGARQKISLSTALKRYFHKFSIAKWVEGHRKEIEGIEGVGTGAGVKGVKGVRFESQGESSFLNTRTHIKKEL